MAALACSTRLSSTRRRSNISAASRAIGAEAGPDGSPQFAERLVALGELGVNDLRTHVLAASVNPVDTKLMARIDEFRVLGFDAVAIVEEVGEGVTRFTPGDRVYYAGSIHRAGSNQTVQLVDERIVAHCPKSLSASQGASIPLAAITAWEALFEKLRLTPQSSGTLLVVGAAGGVGSMVVQLVRAMLPDVTVIGTASRQESRQWVLDLGAHAVIDHRFDLAAQLPPDGVDWIFSTVSKDRVDDYAQALRPFGQVVGIDSGPIDVTPLKSKSASWHWEYMFTRSSPVNESDDQQHRILQSVAELVDAGSIRSTETTVFSGLSIESLTAAHRMVASGSMIGKVVISYE